MIGSLNQIRDQYDLDRRSAASRLTHLMGLDAHAVSLCFGHVEQQISLVRSDRRGGVYAGVARLSGDGGPLVQHS